MPFDTANRDEVKAAIEKQFGKGNLHPGSDTDKPARIPTGDLEFDYATGGGIPKGRFTRFWGSPMAGKSLYCWKVTRSAQEMGMDVVYYNIEKQFDPVFAASQGVDVDKLIVVEGTIIEELAAKLEALVGVYHVHILDSVTQSVSLDELNAKPEDWHRGLAPRVWGKTWRRVNERFDTDHNTIIYCDQVRMNQMTNSEEPPGGKMMEHISSLTIQFKRSKWLFYDNELGFKDTSPKTPSTLSGGVEADGVEFQQKVQKSRVGRPFRQARSRLDLNTYKFDDLWQLTKAATHFGVVKQNGSYFNFPNGDKVQGKAKLRAYIADHPELVEQIQESVHDAS